MAEAPSPLIPRSAAAAVPVAPFLHRAALYPTHYGWYVFLSAVDLVLTWLILSQGGRELNIIAAWVIEQFSVFGIVLFKFGVVAFVVLTCQFVGHHDRFTGQRLAQLAIVLSAFPVTVGATHLIDFAVTQPFA